MSSNEKYIAFLRGINVGGHIVKMEHLRELFRELGFQNVRSFIQTGNVFFESDEKDITHLQEKIQQHLAEKLGYDVPVCLRTHDQLAAIVESNPFKHFTLTPDTRFSVTFLDRKVTKRLPVPSTTADGGYELIGMTDSEMFVIWHLKNRRPANSYVFEKDIDAKATTRFWHTTEKILAAAQKS